MEESRIDKSKKNILFGIIYQIFYIFSNFFIRTVFIKMLNSEYLGINGLFSNILSVLSLAELGIGNAIVFSMYKPLNEKDYEKLSKINYFYKKVYTTIGILIFILGMTVVPALKYIITDVNINMNNIVIYYILFLLNTVSSYFYIYKTSIVTADQNDYIIKRITGISVLVKLIIQIIALILFKSYTIYLIIQLVISVITNFINSKIAEKKYPYIKEKKELDKAEKKDIFKNIKSMFMYQLGGVVLNNTDNILISMIAGTAIVGIYSNYSMIITAVESTIAMIFSALLASIGNYNIKNGSENKYKVFKILNMMANWIYGFASICFLMMFQDFIQLWIGKDYLLKYNVLLITVINFYIRGILYPIWCFRNTTTLFNTTKNIMLVAAILNIILSIILGEKFNLFGILLATALSRMLTNIWYEPKILFKNIFNKKIIEYVIEQVMNIIFIIILYIGVNWIITQICINNIFIKLVVEGIISVILVNIAFFIKFYKTDEFKYIINKVIKKNTKA